MMTGNDEAVSIRAVAIVRDLQRKLANQCFDKGITPEDIALGMLHGTFDVTEAAKGEGITAIEWLRTGLDLLERQLLTGERSGG